jgi:peptidoglycan/LPS O-acetylase OafA/YrhL
MTNQPGSTRNPLDLQDTVVLRGIGILAIVLHNLYHSIPKAVLEMEFAFDSERFPRFLATVGDPRQTFQTLFSYFGHFGVQIFIFLSAYGLALKYWETPVWGRFVWSRIRKIYPMWFLALGLWLILRLIEHRGRFPAFFLDNLDELVLTTLGIISIVPFYGLPPVGPWWFLSFIMQFYSLWPGMARFVARFGKVALLALAFGGVVTTILLNPITTHRWWIDLVETPVGHMPELCLGIAYARYGIRVGLGAALLAIPLFILGNLNALVWPLTFICALTLMLYLYRLTGPVLRNQRFLQFVGEVSMPLFFINGYLRSPFRIIAISAQRWYVTLLSGLCFAAFSIVVAYGLLRLEQRLFARAGSEGRLSQAAS